MSVPSDRSESTARTMASGTSLRAKHKRRCSTCDHPVPVGASYFSSRARLDSWKHVLNTHSHCHSLLQDPTHPDRPFERVCVCVCVFFQGQFKATTGHQPPSSVCHGEKPHRKTPAGSEPCVTRGDCPTQLTLSRYLSQGKPHGRGRFRGVCLAQPLHLRYQGSIATTVLLSP
ncbi:hypothetical protein FA13DRAFT_199972 [Coprinellus micaceus]|uniref:Uncharacterized protein n=1 Tax=Coprinellus micaceus TaxID=71717 RepID=A0A4Y7SG28_COPMI|nr:hypothetical protein FA13DRAFT_199972 [Coprinellus micaceus]